MLQGLLEERFKLRVHRETRDVPVYALTVSEGGPKLQPFQGSCTPRDFDKPPSPADCAVARGRNNGFYMSSATMADFCAPFLVILDRPVIDNTGLTGRFNIHLELTPHDLGIDSPHALPAVSNPAAPANPSDPSRMFAEVRNTVNKLGLNLEPATGPGDFLVIDHIEKPQL
jgi:uncharacterized protein (TIGR03435 family)